MRTWCSEFLYELFLHRQANLLTRLSQETHIYIYIYYARVQVRYSLAIASRDRVSMKRTERRYPILGDLLYYSDVIYLGEIFLFEE